MVDKKTDLEKVLNEQKTKKTQNSMPREQERGYHQGALNTLVNERNELIKMAQIVEQLMQAHMKRLEELGVKIGKK
jgi:hypothetical protein